jgi:hypothetical protein
MTTTLARNRLKKHGKSGNWRFKMLMEAALPNSDVSATEVAKVWPGQNKGDYSFLQGNATRSLEAEMTRTARAEAGEDRHRLLKDYAVDADNLPKTLSANSHINEDGDVIEARLDDAIPRMLFATSDPEEVDTLFREQLLEVVMDGRQLRKVARDASNVINATTRVGDVPVGSDEEFARPTGQGAEIRDDGEDYTTVEWNCTKLTEGSRVTDEMRDQAMVDLIERQIQRVGASVENGINRVFLTELVDDAQANHDTGGSDQGYAALNSAVGEVDSNDFRPDTYVTHPDYRTQLFNDTNLAYANRAGTNEVLRNREDAPIVGDIAGLDMHAAMSGATYPDGSDVGWDAGANTWGFDTDGDLGAVVYDRDNIHTILYAPNGQDVEIKQYDDPIRDITGVNARVHVDAQYSQARSSATIEY